MSAFTDEDFLAWDPFRDDRDTDIRQRTVKIVTTKKPHECYGWDGRVTMHQMPVGTRARYEKAIVDGKWGSYYFCLACMERWFKEAGIVPSATRGRTSA